MEEITYLKDLLEEILDIVSEIYSMGIISVNHNTLKEIKRCSQVCKNYGMIFPASSLERIYTSLSKSMNELDKDFEKEAEELLLLSGWLAICKRELELEEVRRQLV